MFAAAICVISSAAIISKVSQHVKCVLTLRVVAYRWTTVYQSKRDVASRMPLRTGRHLDNVCADDLKPRETLHDLLDLLATPNCGQYHASGSGDCMRTLVVIPPISGLHVKTAVLMSRNDLKVPTPNLRASTGVTDSEHNVSSDKYEDSRRCHARIYHVDVQGDYPTRVSCH